MSTTTQEPELIQTRIPADVSRWVKNAADRQSLSVAAWLRAHLTKLASGAHVDGVGSVIVQRKGAVTKLRAFSQFLRKKPAKIDPVQLAGVIDSLAQTLEEDVNMLGTLDP